KPDMLIGHSLGGEIVQLAQSRLLRTGHGLRHKYGIRAVLLLVPDIAAPLPWVAADAGAFDPLIGPPFVRNDPIAGPIMDLLRVPGGPETWVSLNYADRAGTVIAAAPTPAQAVANGFISFESGTLMAQLVGLPATPGGPRTPRPAVDADIFA